MATVHIVERVVRLTTGWALLVDYHYDGATHEYTLGLPTMRDDLTDEEVMEIAHRPEVLAATRKLFLADVYLVGGAN